MKRLLCTLLIVVPFTLTAHDPDLPKTIVSPEKPKNCVGKAYGVLVATQSRSGCSDSKLRTLRLHSKDLATCVINTYER